MTENELRIGNWLWFPFHKEFVQVKGVGVSAVNEQKMMVQVFTQGMYLMEGIHSFEPVQLTKDILSKCGFVAVGYDNIFEKNELIIGIHEGCVTSLRDCNLDEIGKPFKYLHQLQNLYLCLTGEELTFNPKL